MKSAKALDVTILVFKILVILAVVFSFVATGVFSFRLIQSCYSDWENANTAGYHSGTGLYIFLTLILSSLINVGVVALNSIGMLISALYKRCPERSKNVRFFGLCYIAPGVSQWLYLVVMVVLRFVF